MIVAGPIVGYWVAKRVFGHYNEGSSSAIGFQTSEINSGVIYENWNKSSVTCHIACDGLFGSREYLHAIFNYPFITLGVNKIIAPIGSGNDESIRIVKKMGFSLEATIKDAHPDGDFLIYTMKHDQCKYLKERYGKRLTIAASST